MTDKGGHDLPFTTRFQIYNMAKQGETAWKIHKSLNISYKAAARWSDPKRIEEIEKTGSFASKRLGVVGRKHAFDKGERDKLMDRLEKPGMTQTKLARQESVTRKTIRAATRYDSEGNSSFTPNQSDMSEPRWLLPLCSARCALHYTQNSESNDGLYQKESNRKSSNGL